ncbi:MAG: tetratricopeptide repeat protein [Chloroflexota bacterium]
MADPCPRCGFKKNPPGMRYCGNCGMRLGGEPSEPAPLAAAGSGTEDLGVMIGGDLAERMRRAGLEARGQRRNVTVLFADLSGYTALSGKIDSEELFELVQRYVRLLSKDVYKYEGIVDKLTGDGLMALFGAPITHENNAERAVLAALEMQNDLAELNRDMRKRLGEELNMRIGLHAGTVVVGGIGSDLLMDYTAIGDTVNLAHRIEEAAPPGAILVSEAVYRQVRALFDCQQISILNPKGVAHPVIAYRVVGPKARPGLARGLEGLQAPMIGRDQELARLQFAVDELSRHRQGQFALITGEAGLGKSRLVAELQARLDPKALLMLQGRSLAYRRTVPYWIIRELLYNWLGLSNASQPYEVSEKLQESTRQLMGAQAEDALPFLENLLSLPPSGPASAERLRHLDAGQLRQQTFLTVRDLFLLESYRQPLLLILDDLHWADDASLELFTFLLDQLKKSQVMVLAITRSVLPGFLEKAVNWAKLNLGERFYDIQLHGLSLDQSELLVSLLLSIPRLPDNFRRHIVERAAGIPFYLEEILRMLIDEGLLRSQNGGWEVVPGADPTALGVPANLQELILARYDRLTQMQKRVLQIASVIGKDFSLSILHQAYLAAEPMQSLDNQALQVSVESLVDRQFVLPLAETELTEYTFRHALMSEAIYGTLLRKDRRALHGRVGEVIERFYANRLDDLVELLANHYRWSDRPERALHYLILAGEKAARNNVFEQSRQHYQAALDMLPDLEHQPHQAQQVHMGIGEALAFFGSYPEARQQYQRALEAIASNNLEAYAQDRSCLYRKIARTYERKGDYQQALANLNLAQDPLKTAPLAYPMEQAEILSDIGWIYFRQGDFPQAEALLKRALELAEPTSAIGVVASIYNRLGGIMGNQGDWEQAATYLRKSIAIREAIGDVVGLASSSNNLGYLEVEMGEYDNALVDLRRNYELVKRLGQVEGIAIALNNLGWLYIRRGDMQEAERCLNQSLEMARQIGYSSLVREALKNIGELHLAMGEWEQARQVLQEFVAFYEEQSPDDQLLGAYILLGEAALGAGDDEVALDWSRKVNDMAEKMGDGELPAVLNGELLRFRGILAMRLGAYTAADDNLRESAAIFHRLRSRLHLGRAIYQYGLLAETQGDRNNARLRYLEASQLFRNLGARLDARRAEEAYKRQLSAG